MVWDTASMRVAEVDELPAIRLSEETAKRFCEMLNSQDPFAGVERKSGPK